MKKMVLRALLSVTLCAAMLCGSALAAEDSTRPGPVCVWGTVTTLDDGGLLVENNSGGAAYSEIILHGEGILFLDAVTGMPLERELRDGETIYAWIGPAVTMSLPPHGTALLVLANIPADYAVPQYYEVAAVEPHVSIAIYPTPPLSMTELVTSGGEHLTVTDKAELTPYLTKNIVRLEDLIPGTRILVWTGTDGEVSRVLVFPYEYRGYITWTETGAVSVNDERLAVSGKVTEDGVLLPVRAVAEALGYDVNWVPGKGAVVSENGEAVLTAMPGGDVQIGAEEGYPAACVLEKGVTYLEADTLVQALNLYPGA